MNTAVYIAKRYLFSRKSVHAINIISGISMLGVFVGSAALIIILSAFNGLENVILSLYSNFSPEIKIEAKMGKTFNPDTPYFQSLNKDARVFSYTQVLQEKVLLRYGNKQFIGTVKGVSNDFLKNTRLDSTILSGSFTIKVDGINYAVIGATIQASLGVNVDDQLAMLQVYSPRRTATASANPLNEFVVQSIKPAGVFAIQQEFDDILVTPLSFTRELLDEPDQVSSLELNFKKGTDIDEMQEEIEEAVGENFIVKNRVQQNTELYKTLNYERWSVFMILTFVMIIAVFNIVGSLTMLVMDKKKDIAILTSLGAGKSLIQRIFFVEGMMISFFGCVAGLMVGLIFAFAQQIFGFVKVNGSLSVMEAYPIHIVGSDILLVFVTVGTVSVIASAISAGLSVKGLNDLKQDL
ncbi:MAG: ABC transporter permease [Sphingobacteriaceae bacterium]|nr:MAG: ABC transporter permease [Sphingobacteriaceae bacterium]